MAAFYTPEPYSPSEFDDQVEWVTVRVPVRVSSGLPLPSEVSAMTTFYSPPYVAPQPIWGQESALSLFPPENGDVSQSNIALALSLQACLAQQDFSGLGVPPPTFSYPDACFDTDTTLAMDFGTSVAQAPSPSDSSFVPSPFVADAWPLTDNQYTSDSNSSSNLGSPTTTATEATDTPCSTPPTPQAFFCPDATCFEQFTRATDLKYATPSLSPSPENSGLTMTPPRRHERKHRQNFRCELCGKAHADRRALNRHLESKHEEYALRNGVKSEKIRCRFCEYVSRADNVRRHERSQHGSAR